MSSNFKLAATTAVLLSTLSFTATAGDTRYFADVAPKNNAITQDWDFEALIRHDGNDRRLIVEIGGITREFEETGDEDDTYTPKDSLDPVSLIAEDSCETALDEGVSVTICELVTPIQIKVFAEGTVFKYRTTEVAWEASDDDPNANLCGGAGIVLRTDKDDNVPNVQPGSKVVINLVKATNGKIGVGTFSEEEPAPAGVAPEGCPVEPIELEEEEE